MLAKMHQLCPASENRTALFHWIFMRRLREKFKLMLVEDHTSSANKLVAWWADKRVGSMTKAARMVAAITEDDVIIGAATAPRPNFNRGGRHMGFQRGTPVHCRQAFAAFYELAHPGALLAAPGSPWPPRWFGQAWQE